MDYEVFLLSRIQEEWLRTHDNRWAVAHGLEKTGGVITNAALLFMIVAGAFIFTSILLIQEMGIGLTVAVLVDAAIIRMLLVPATMRLLGRWNWWLPGRPLPPKQAG
jgi:RND superfamily putative drug exporter